MKKAYRVKKEREFQAVFQTGASLLIVNLSSTA